MKTTRRVFESANGWYVAVVRNDGSHRQPPVECSDRYFASREGAERRADSMDAMDAMDAEDEVR